MDILKYKDFEGSAELDMQHQVCRGKILFIDDLITYESKSIDGLQKQFEEAVEDYLETCKEIGKEPQKSCKGLFNVRVSPELHKSAIRRALVDGTSLNDVVFKALQSYLSAEAKSIQTMPRDSSMSHMKVYSTNLAQQMTGVTTGVTIVGGGSSNTVLVRMIEAAQAARAGAETCNFWSASGSQIAEIFEDDERIYVHQ